MGYNIIQTNSNSSNKAENKYNLFCMNGLNQTDFSI